MRDKSELEIAKKLGGRMTNGSGCVSDDADIKIPGFLIEAKRRETTGNKIVFYPKIWEKLRKQSIKCNRTPLYCFQAGGQTFFITYRDVYDSDLMRDMDVLKTIIDTEPKTNIIIPIEEFDDLYNLAYKVGKVPLLLFKHFDIIYGVTDIKTMKTCLDRRFNG